MVLNGYFTWYFMQICTSRINFKKYNFIWSSATDKMLSKITLKDIKLN